MSLSSLIVQREIATIRQVEEALARQVLYGGDLVTNLLEVAQLPESELMPLVAEAVGLPAAPIGELPAPSDDARAMVPAELASRRALVPLHVVEGRLVLVVSEPLAPEVLEELSFALGMSVEQRIAPLVRVRQALATSYGTPLDRRLQRLLGRLSGIDTKEPSSLPPLVRSAVARHVDTLSGPPPDVGPVTPGTRGHVATLTGPPIVAPAPTPAPTAVYAPDPGLRTRATPAMGSRPPRQTADGFPAPPAPIPALDAPPIGVGLVPDTSPTDPAPPVISQPPPEVAPAVVAVAAPGAAPPAPQPNVARAAPAKLVHVAHPGAAPRARRRRGPLPLEQAKKELEGAGDRDALLDLFFDFSRQFFDYAALFIVHGDIAEGRDAYGAGASRDKVAAMGVPLDLPSLLATARDRRAPLVARPAGDGLGIVKLNLGVPHRSAACRAARMLARFTIA